jgi:hypothetical protein
MNISKTLEEEMLDHAAKNIAREIDQNLMDDITIAILINDGWTETNLNPAYTDTGMLSGKYEEWYSKTAEWVHINAQGEYKLVKGQWLFEDPKDATMFILRWSSD